MAKENKKSENKGLYESVTNEEKERVIQKIRSSGVLDPDVINLLPYIFEDDEFRDEVAKALKDYMDQKDGSDSNTSKP